MADKAMRNRMQRALTAAGFRREFKCKDCTQYRCSSNSRTVMVQLWRDGMCRVSVAFVYGEGNQFSQETTPPTSFESVAAMHAAIFHEFTRPLPEWKLICDLPDKPTTAMVLWNPCDGAHLVSTLYTPEDMARIRDGKVYWYWRELVPPMLPPK